MSPVAEAQSMTAQTPTRAGLMASSVPTSTPMPTPNQIVLPNGMDCPKEGRYTVYIDGQIVCQTYSRMEAEVYFWEVVSLNPTYRNKIALITGNWTLGEDRLETFPEIQCNEQSLPAVLFNDGEYEKWDGLTVCATPYRGRVGFVQVIKPGLQNLAGANAQSFSWVKDGQFHTQDPSSLLFLEDGGILEWQDVEALKERIPFPVYEAEACGIGASRLNVRQEPGLDAPVVAKLTEGQRFEVTGWLMFDEEYSWRPIKLTMEDGMSADGWVADVYHCKVRGYRG